MKRRAATKLLVVIGTRPEAIKMAPVIAALRQCEAFELRVCVTAQHRELLDQVLEFFAIHPDIDLDLMEPGQSLDELASRLLLRLGEVLDAEHPDRVIVHGDTLTASMAALSCYLRRIPVGHVEAGLRSGDSYAPWPEEVCRKHIDAIADLHFAPTRSSAQTLLREGCPADGVFVTGNSGIDALIEARALIAAHPGLAPVTERLRSEHKGKRTIAVTAHRRENMHGGMQQIADALTSLARRADVAIAMPLHPNPGTATIMREALGGTKGITLLDPLSYPDFVALLDFAELVLTDSGGIQEEAPSLNTPVLVMRDTTERPEGITAGVARLVGTESTAIVQAVTDLLDDPDALHAMKSAGNPYGNGTAAQQIRDILVQQHALPVDKLSPRPASLHVVSGSEQNSSSKADIEDPVDPQRIEEDRIGRMM